MKQHNAFSPRGPLVEALTAVFGLAFFAAVTTAALEPKPGTEAKPPEAKSAPAGESEKPTLDLAAAEKTYTEIYGAQHTAAEASKKPTDKLKYAQSLLDAVSKLSGDSSATGLCWVMRQKAASFATSAGATGYSLAMDALKANLALTPKEPAVLEPLATVMEKMIPTLKPDQRAQAGHELALLYIRWTDLQIERAELPAAAQTIGLARSCIRSRCRNDAALLAVVRGQERQVETIQALKTKAEKAKPVLAVNANDPEANTDVGLHALLVEHKPDVAGPLLSKSSNEHLRKLGETLTAAAGDDYALAEAYRAAAGVASLDRAVTEGFREESVRLYRKVLADQPDHPQAVKIKLLLPKEAPATGTTGTPTTKTATKKAEPKTEPGSPGPGWVQTAGWTTPYFPDRGFLIRYSDNFRLNVGDQFIEKTTLEETFEDKTIEVWICQQNKYYHVLGTRWVKVVRR